MGEGWILAYRVYLCSFGVSIFSVKKVNPFGGFLFLLVFDLSIGKLVENFNYILIWDMYSKYSVIQAGFCPHVLFCTCYSRPISEERPASQKSLEAPKINQQKGCEYFSFS